MTPVFEIENLVKTYRDFWGRERKRALQGVTLSGEAGEAVGLLGPNGSGKSTAIKTLLGLLSPTSGSVRLFGENPDSRAVRARIGYLPEISIFHKFLTPRETLRYHAGLLNMPGDLAKARIELLFDRVGISSRDADRQVGEFSKGMARRVGLAQALLGDPEFVVFDEPTSGLDPVGRHDVKTLIKELAAEGKTILFSSHLLSEVEDVCSRIAILVDGRIRASGPLGELLPRAGSVQAVFKDLPPETLEALEADWKKRGLSPEISPVRQSLEDFFLTVLAEGGKKS